MFEMLKVRVHPMAALFVLDGRGFGRHELHSKHNQRQRRDCGVDAQHLNMFVGMRYAYFAYGMDSFEHDSEVDRIEMAKRLSRY